MEGTWVIWFALIYSCLDSPFYKAVFYRQFTIIGIAQIYFELSHYVNLFVKSYPGSLIILQGHMIVSIQICSDLNGNKIHDVLMESTD